MPGCTAGCSTCSPGGGTGCGTPPPGKAGATPPAGRSGDVPPPGQGLAPPGRSWTTRGSPAHSFGAWTVFIVRRRVAVDVGAARILLARHGVVLVGGSILAVPSSYRTAASRAGRRRCRSVPRQPALGFASLRRGVRGLLTADGPPSRWTPPRAVGLRMAPRLPSVGSPSLAGRHLKGALLDQDFLAAVSGTTAPSVLLTTSAAAVGQPLRARAGRGVLAPRTSCRSRGEAVGRGQAGGARSAAAWPGRRGGLLRAGTSSGPWRRRAGVAMGDVVSRPGRRTRGPA
jgi:hypothetical protein